MIKEIYFPLHTLPWQQWRWHHIGGSDISAVCAGYSQDLAEISWTPPIKYYLQMIGEPVTPFSGNVPSNMGQYIESVIIDLYRCYDHSIPPDKDNTHLMTMFDRRKKNRRVNRIICRHNYVWNTDYPHLSGSPDGFIYENRGRGILEVKNMTSMEQNRYANKINPGHVLQCQHNMLCAGADYCDLIRLIDGTWMDVIRFEADKEQQDFILYCASDFWKKVLLARDIKEKNGIEAYYDMNFEFFTTPEEQEAVGVLQSMEPDFIGSDTELKWLKEYIKPVSESIERDILNTEESILSEYKGAHARRKACDLEVNKEQAKLITSMKGYQVVNADGGYYSYKNNKNGVPRFYMTPKLLAN